MSDALLWFSDVGMGDVDKVGGKNASLGEMIGALADSGVQVPGGFATTAQAYRDYLQHNKLEAKIEGALADLDVEDIAALKRAGREIRSVIEQADFPPPLEEAIRDAYAELSAQHAGDIAVAVRSSATAEDLPDASFAGQQETLLNVRGIDAVLSAIKCVFASLFNDRAIAYRVHHGFAHGSVALSAGIQFMVRSDLAASGVMFTLDTESGFRDVIFINAAYGLGETVVQGAVNPDEFYVHKPTLAANRPAIVRRQLGEKAIKMVYGDAASLATMIVDVPTPARRQFCIDDAEVITLANLAVTIEEHYGRPMDIEWAKDGATGALYIVQARPETVQSRGSGATLQRFELIETGPIFASGRSVGQRIGVGSARVIRSVAEIDKVQPGDVLVTDMTDPDWEPVMKRAAAIVTNRGGRTCHAAIVARELGVPAIVGCGDATETVPDGDDVTVSCAEGDTGNVYAGSLEFAVKNIELAQMPALPFKIMLNVGNPERAFDFQALPNEGVGLARIEFIINQMIGVHPKALLEYDSLPGDLKEQIDVHWAGYSDPVDFYVTKLAEGISVLAAAFWPKPVIVRLSDFKSNEYANLLGGDRYEPSEENPMIGFRGASRYRAESFRDCFALECRALKYVRDQMGLTNVEAMIPFVRTVDEAIAVLEIMSLNGLSRGENGLRIIMMCEIPSNALLAERFLEHFDGFSIGSNDLTQLTLGLDRDSALVADLFDERNPAVKALLSQAIAACHREQKYVGICGQGPSDHPDLARWLMDQGIDSVSLNPDSVVATWLFLAGKEL